MPPPKITPNLNTDNKKKEALRRGVPLPSTPKGIRTSTERTGIFNPIH